MNYAIRYFTSTGNTAKLANAIADAIGVKAESVEQPLTERVDTLFLGCSYYAFDMDPEVKSFIAANKEKIGKVVCFGTSALMKSMKKPLQRVLNGTGVTLAEEEFHCWGTFKGMRKGHPDADDLKAAAAFARAIVK